MATPKRDAPSPLLPAGLASIGRRVGWGLLGLLLLAVLLDTFVPSLELIGAYPKHLIFMSLLYSTLALSLNYVAGYVGQVSLGHAAFYGFGAYTAAMLTFYTHISFWLALPIAGLVTAVLGVVLGLPALRVKGPFLVIVTYSLGEVLRFVAINLKSTGGPAGLPGLPAPKLGVALSDIGATGKEAFILLALLLVVVLAVLSRRLERSPVGRAFAAVKTDEVAAGAMGIHVDYYKLLAFTLAAAFAGLAGAIYAHYLSYVSPDVFSPQESILILAMVIIGGAGSIAGVITGAFALTLIPELFKLGKDVLGFNVDPWTTLFGLLLILVIRFKPEGLIAPKAASK